MSVCGVVHIATMDDFTFDNKLIKLGVENSKCDAKAELKEVSTVCRKQTVYLDKLDQSCWQNVPEQRRNADREIAFQRPLDLRHQCPHRHAIGVATGNPDDHVTRRNSHVVWNSAGQNETAERQRVVLAHLVVLSASRLDDFYFRFSVFVSVGNVAWPQTVDFRSEQTANY